MIIGTAGIVGAAVLGALSLLHLYWAFGGRAGRGAVVPTAEGRPLLSPSRAATIVVAGLLAASAALLVGAAREWPPHAGFRVGAAGVGVVLLARAVGERRYLGFFKRKRDTDFARRDTWLYSPLCLALGAIAVVAAATS